ncbi:hypothetical protein ACP70R_033267 [Stipagrostis hirtigluma subsp. patula]
MLLSVLAVMMANGMFTVVLLHYRHDIRWMLVYFAFTFFNLSLYTRRRLPRQRVALRLGLGYAAVVLGVLLTALFFCGFDHGISSWLAVAVWIGLVVAARFFYLLLVLHLEADEAAVRVQQLPRLPV